MSTEVGTLKASLNLDARKFAAGMQQAISLTKDFSRVLKTALGEGASQGFTSLLRDISATKTEVSKLKTQITSFNAAMAKAAAPSGFIQMQQYTSRMRNDLAAANANINQFNGALTNAKGQMQGVAGAAKETVITIDQATGQVLQLSSNAQQAAGNTQGIASAADKTDANLDDAARAAKKIAQETQKTNTANKKLEKSTQNVKVTMEKTLKFATDFKRIIAGIIISQAFYELVGIMQELVRGAMKFTNNMDQAKIAFEYLLDDATQATDMIMKLQDFAIKSPLDTTAVMDSTRKLMAMGFTAKSVIPTLGVLADTAAVFSSEAGGMSDMISHVTLAVGQMLASGKVMMQEMRQLYNAGVPVFEIFREELNLTAEQVRNIGRQGIDSKVAVMALLNGLQKRYKGAAEAFTKTIPGALEVIKDSIYVIYAMLVQKPHNALREWIVDISNKFQALVAITRTYGIGGFLQAIFPKRLWHSIRAIIGSFQQLGRAIKVVYLVLKDNLAKAWEYIAYVLGIVLPPITTFINMLAQAAKWAYTTIPYFAELAAAFTALMVIIIVVNALSGLYRLLHIGKIVAWFTTHVWASVVAMAKWIKATAILIATHWALALSILGVIIVLGLLIASSKELQASFGKIIDGFKKLGAGFKVKDIWPETFTPPKETEIDDGGIQDLIDDMTMLGDVTDETQDSLNNMFNQSFDEVYSIDPNKGKIEGPLSGFNAVDMADILASLESMQDISEELDFSGVFGDDWLAIQESFDISALNFESIIDAFSGATEELLVAAGILVAAFAVSKFGIGWSALVAGLGLSASDFALNLADLIKTWPKGKISEWFTTEFKTAGTSMTSLIPGLVGVIAMLVASIFFGPLIGVIIGGLAFLWTKLNKWLVDKITPEVQSFVYYFTLNMQQLFFNINVSIIQFCTDITISIVQFFITLYLKASAFVEDMIAPFKVFGIIIDLFWTKIKITFAYVVSKIKEAQEDIKRIIDDIWNLSFGKFFNWIDEALKKITEFLSGIGLINGIKIEPTMGIAKVGIGTPVTGTKLGQNNANGGIYDQEHLSWLSEGNKREAVIPLQNDSAMQPFADSVAKGIVSVLAPLLANQNSQLPPVYVGTLIADEHGLRELERKMRVIRIKEERRGG